jgi:hypothetical protein
VYPLHSITHAYTARKTDGGVPHRPYDVQDDHGICKVRKFELSLFLYLVLFLLLPLLLLPLLLLSYIT